MTIDKIALQELLEKGPDADLLREMIGFVAERLMALDVEGLRPRRAHAFAHQPAQRLSRAAVGHAGWSCRSPSSARARTSRAFWRHGGPQRRR